MEKKSGKKTENIRVTSIARRINFQSVLRRLWSYIVVDFFAVLLFAAAFVYAADVVNAGGFSIFNRREIFFGSDEAGALTEESVDDAGALADNVADGANGVDADGQGKKGRSIEDLVYRVSSPAWDVEDSAYHADSPERKEENMRLDKHEALYTLEIGKWLYPLCVAGCAVLVIELFQLINLAVYGTRLVRENLRPLNEIAARAHALSELAFDEAKYRSLEDAISKLKVDAIDTGIHMHDKDLRGIETALNGLLERIRDAYRQQAQFVSDASHELRTPIAVIQGYVNMLDRWGKEDEAVLEESIEAIKNESNHMQKLVEQLLFLARGDFNRQNLDMQRLCLNDVMREVYDESVMIDEKHHYIYEETEKVFVYGDNAMLKQSARILIDNAAKYTDEGEEIIIRAGEKGGSPCYSVQDNGIGMSAHDLEHAFDRFYRADTVRSSKTGGTGLGLSIAKWIVDRHGGYYDILSREGIGTRFDVVFPQV